MRAVVLGSGVIGVTTAYALAKDGHQVTVIDRQPVPANETSFANAGLVAPGHAYTWASPRAPGILWRSLFRDDQALRLKLSADPRMWSWCLKFLRNCTAEKSRRNTTRKLGLCVYSQHALRELVAETGIAYDGRAGGLLYLYRDAAAFARGQTNMAVLRDNGQRMEILDTDGVVRVEPALADARDTIAGAIFCPDDESGDANMFTLGLAEKCRALGVEFRLDTRITGFDTEGDTLQRVLTDKGPVEGDVFVLALGVQSAIIGRKLGLTLPIYPVKGYSATVPIGGRNGAPSIGGVDENNLVAFARMGDRLRLTAVAEFAGYDTSHRPENFKTMLDAAKALFPNGGDYDKATYWAGLRPMTPEGTPIFGRGRQRNLYLNTGHGHMGWTMSCGSARVTADLIAGRKPAIDLAGMVYGQA
ncbi:MAG TPA: D-amino acid dehydrogenase [Stellaceae bacterium]|nr:D-amino acid dehydrogenase [Stellaceae bacterium]